MGSLNYMSPEQVSGGKATTRSDIYSVGVTLYELLTGQLPITGTGAYEVMVGHMQQVPPAPHQLASGVPLALSATVMRALEKDPAMRFATAEEFLIAIEQVSHVTRQESALTLPLPSPPAIATRSSTGSAQQKQSSGSGLQSLPLEEISRKLATYIGPVAKIVVKKLAAQSDDLDFIYREAARQIPSDADRAAFLRSKNK
jgi:serine/threonine-protein kinase